MERIDTIAFLFLFYTALIVLFYNFEYTHDYPYFIVTTFIFSLSIGIFFISLSNMTREWFHRLAVVNIIMILLLPFIEGMEWIWFSVLYYSLLAFLFIGYYFYKSRQNKTNE